MTHLALGRGREFDRVRAIARALGPRAHELGDDAAILPEGEGRVVLSVDLSVEGVHFRRDWITAEEIGWRATMAALSDLAAMAAAPVGVLASVAAPDSPEGSAEDMLAVMTGVGAAAGAVGAVVLGGDLSGGPAWILDVTAVGRAVQPVRRSGAREGDDLIVTGHLGGARLAVAEWRAGRAPAPSAREAFARPVARCAAARVLASAGASAMIDLSDGLGGDAGHLAAAAGVAIEVEVARVPVHPALRARYGDGPEASVEATAGGEDYELLFTMPPGVDLAALADRAGVPLTRVGTVRGGAGVRCLLEGGEVAIPGHDHFS